MSFKIKTGDTNPPLTRTLRDEDNEPLVLTDSSVDFVMRSADTAELKVDSEATIVDETEGKVEYQWEENDTEENGMFFAEFHITYNDNSVESYPKSGYIIVQIQDSLN